MENEIPKNCYKLFGYIKISLFEKRSGDIARVLSSLLSSGYRLGLVCINISWPHSMGVIELGVSECHGPDIETIRRNIVGWISSIMESDDDYFIRASLSIPDC